MGTPQLGGGVRISASPLFEGDRGSLIHHYLKTLTRRLPEKYRSAVRFVCVGTFGTALQYAIYYGFLALFDVVWAESTLRVTTAFTLGFCIEMIANYFLTSFYTFRTRPSVKNAGGFMLGRLVNYLIQVGFLHILIACTLSEELSGIVAIMLAGVVNYFVLVPFYSRKKEQKTLEQVIEEHVAEECAAADADDAVVSHQDDTVVSHQDDTVASRQDAADAECPQEK